MSALFDRGVKSALVAGVLLVSAQSTLRAGTLTGTFAVSATVPGAACTSISATAMAFGSVAATGTASSTSTVTINCANGTAYSLTATGAAPDCISGTTYNLMNGGNNAPVYTLFKDAAHTLPLLPGPQVTCGNTTAITGTGTAQPTTQTIYGLAYGALPGSTNTTPAGTYSDTATITLSF